MNTIKIFLVDDHKLFIEGIISLLSEEDCLQFVGYSLNPAEVRDKVDEIDADVFIIDINMPEMSGITLTKFIMEKKPDSKILALTMYNDYRHIEKMIKSGALGYSQKSDNIEELIKAIKTVARGRKFICESIQQTIVNNIGSIHKMEETEIVSKSKLTEREMEVLLLIIKEYNNREIAEKLFISRQTVETHRKNIFSKANTSSAVGLLKYAIKEGIIQV